MSPRPSEWLSDMSIAEYTVSATSAVATYAGTWAVRAEALATEQDSFGAYCELCAAEFALAPLYRGSLDLPGELLFSPEQIENAALPVQVTRRHAEDAIYKTDCGPFMEHQTKALREIRPWDVFAFAGDMSKLELLGFAGDVNAIADPMTMDGFLRALAERYGRTERVAGQIVNSGLLAAHGAIWLGKISLLHGVQSAPIDDVPFITQYFPPESIAIKSPI